MNEVKEDGVRRQGQSVAPSHGFTLPQHGILTDSEWAERFQMDVQGFRDWIKERGIPFIPINRGILVEAPDLYQFGKVIYDKATGERRRIAVPVGQDVGGVPERAAPKRKAKKG